MGVLREVADEDLPVCYEHQRDPETAAHAAFPPSDRDAFMANWAKALERLRPDEDGGLRRGGRRQHRLLEG